MHTVAVPLPADGFSTGMAEMRAWLDRNGYETKRFDCAKNGDEVVLLVDFMSDRAAEAFEKEFQGFRQSPSSPGPL